MPMTNGTYVRYSDGSSPVTYGVIVEVRQATYCIRVGGTDTVVEVPHGQVALHTAVVASGAGLGGLSNLRIQVGDKFLYHATSFDLLPNIASKQGISPRSRVDWESLGPSVWTGAEAANGRVTSVTVKDMQYFKELSETAKHGAIPDSTLLGDVGEFFYATTRHDDNLINYVNDVFSAGKAPVVVRFKAPNMAWYSDPKAKAVMTMNTIPLRIMQMRYVPKALKGIAAEDALVAHLGKDEGWVPCADGDWMETITLENQLDF